MKKTLLLALGLITIAALPACETAKEVGDIGGQFWQRTSASESLYLQGPKAQQILNRDIARCVTELRELERLGAVKNAIPTDIKGHVLTVDEMEMADWDSPERDKQLFAEHSDYADFESCMTSKGWERIEHVPYDVTRKGRKNYLAAHVKYNEEAQNKKKKKKKNKHRRQTTQNTGSFGNLND